MTHRSRAKEVAIRLSMEQFIELTESDGGFCLACRETAYGIEPDARNYRCEFCEEHEVFAAEELFQRGQIEILDEDEEDDA